MISDQWTVGGNPRFRISDFGNVLKPTGAMRNEKTENGEWTIEQKNAMRHALCPMPYAPTNNK